MSAAPDCEVEEGSSFGGVECEESALESEQENVETLCPLDSLAVEFYEDPEENSSKNGSHSSEADIEPSDIMEQEMDTAVESTDDVESAQDFYGAEMKEMDDASENGPTDTSGVEYNDDSVASEAFDSSTLATEEETEPDYKEMQTSYLQDFMYSNASSFDEGSNSIINSNVDEVTDDQKGLPLSRFPRIVKAVERCDYETIQVLFQLIYQRSAWDTQEILSGGILSFSGFNFNQNSEDYSNREMMLQTLPDDVLAKIAVLLNLEQVEKMITDVNKGRPALIEAIMHFIAKPSKKNKLVRAGLDPALICRHLPKHCGCRNTCFRRFTKLEQKRLYDYMNELKEKNLLEKYIISLIELKKIVRTPESIQESRKLKEVFYLYKVKFDTKEAIVCKGAFMALHDLKIGKMNALQRKMKTGKLEYPQIDPSEFPPLITDEYKELLRLQEEKKPKRSTPKKTPPKLPQPKPEKKIWMPTQDQIRQMEEELKASVPKCTAEKKPKERVKLKEFPLVVKSIEDAADELLVDVHFLLFLSSAEEDQIKSNILEFSGFTFEPDTEEYDERNEFLQRMTFKIVSEVARSFSLAVLNTKELTIKNLLKFLTCPEDSYLRTNVTMPLSLSDVELDDLGDIGDMSDSDVSITCEVVEKKVECIDLISSGEDSDGGTKPRKEKKSPKKAVSTPSATTVQTPVVTPIPQPTIETPAVTPSTSIKPEPSTGVRTLRNFETICKIVNTHPHEYLVDIYELLYMKKHEPSTLRSDILDFSGFTFAMKSSEYIKRKQLLDRMLYNSVRRIYNTLIHNTTEVKVFSKPTMITEVFQFLFKLPDYDTSIRIQPQMKPVVKPLSLTPKPVPTIAAPPPGLNLPNQTGKLSDLKRVFQRVACFPCEYLIDVHKLLFMTDCDSKVIRQNIFAFKGFNFGPESQDFQQRKMYLEYLTFHSLRKISSVLTTRSVDLRNSTKHELATHLTQVLAEYCHMSIGDVPVETGNATQSVTSTTSDLNSNGIENIVVTPFIDPSLAGYFESPDMEAAGSVDPISQPSNPSLAISIVDARSVQGQTAPKPVVRRKRKTTPTKQPIEPVEQPQQPTSQFADINLPEVEQYRQLYGQTLNIYNPSGPTITGITTLNPTTFVPRGLPASGFVPQTMSFSMLNAYSQPIQVRSPFRASAPLIGVPGIPQTAQPTIITQVPSKKNEIIVPGDLVGDSDEPASKKPKTNEQNGTDEDGNKNSKKRVASKEEDGDCDKPLSSLVGHPIDSVLTKHIGDIVEESDLESLTINSVIQKVFSLYPKFDLSYRKEFIKSTLRSILYKLGEEDCPKRNSNSPDSSVTTTNAGEDSKISTKPVESS